MSKTVVFDTNSTFLLCYCWDLFSFDFIFISKNTNIATPTIIPRMKLAINDKLQIAPAAIALPSQGSLALIGLQGFITIIKIPRIIPTTLPPIKMIKKVRRLAANGYFKAKFFISKSSTYLSQKGSVLRLFSRAFMKKTHPYKKGGGKAR